MAAARRLDGEILDVLPPEDARAIASRADLARINIIMRHRAIMLHHLLRFSGSDTILDLGAGDGAFMLAVARRLAPHRPGLRILLADSRNSVSNATRRAFTDLGWRCEPVVGDIFDLLDHAAGSVVTANLFLHHLSDEALQRLFARVAPSAAGFVACEPRRAPFALLASKLVILLGANDVTRHDAVASVRAGFRDDELSRLWPDPDWSLDESHAWPFSHCFVAQRRGSGAHGG